MRDFHYRPQCRKLEPLKPVIRKYQAESKEELLRVSVLLRELDVKQYTANPSNKTIEIYIF